MVDTVLGRGNWMTGSKRQVGVGEDGECRGDSHEKGGGECGVRRVLDW